MAFYSIYTDTHTHVSLTVILPSETALAGFPLRASSLIPFHHISLRQLTGAELLWLDALPVTNQCQRHPLDLILSSTTNNSDVSPCCKAKPTIKLYSVENTSLQQHLFVSTCMTQLFVLCRCENCVAGDTMHRPHLTAPSSVHYGVLRQTADEVDSPTPQRSFANNRHKLTFE